VAESTSLACKVFSHAATVADAEAATNDASDSGAPASSHIYLCLIVTILG